ncbi:JAB domain-containing protein [Gilvibacter sp.]|uniref:JAB domain-containing protein n=1 Tax=Gilvibacter sp. TaxID=2729997 RepID=UPI003B523B91
MAEGHQIESIQDLLLWIFFAQLKIISSLNSSKKAFEILRDKWDNNTVELQEEFKVLLIDRDNTVLGIYSLSKGGIAGTVVDVRLILVAALKAKASAIILAHNHPSGNLKPSGQDLNLTKKIIKATKLLDIDLLDHIILSNQDYYSFSDESDL